MYQILTKSANCIYFEREKQAPFFTSQTAPAPSGQNSKLVKYINMTEKTKGIIIIAVANGLIAMGYGLSVPFFAIYLNTQKGVPASVIGIMLALAMLTTAFASMLSGEVSDTFGRKRVMTISLFLRSLSMIAIAATMFFDMHYFWSMAFHFAGSFLGAFFRPASNAWIADNTTPSERVTAFSYMRIGLNLGWAIGPALGGLLAHTSYSLGFALTGLTFLFSMFYVSKNIKESIVKTHSRKTDFVQTVLELKNKTLARMCISEFFISMVTSQLVVGLSLHCVNRLGFPENKIGWFFSLQGLAVVLFQYHTAKLVSKIRLTSALAIGCALYAVGYGSIGFMVTFWAIGAGVILSALGEMCVLPAGHSLTSNIAPDNKRGRFLGLYVLANQGGMAAGIFMAGVLMENISPIYAPGPWLIVALLAVIAGASFYGIRRRVTDEQDGLKPKQSVPIVKQFPS